MAIQLTTNQLPVFAQNQVLRAEDLNNLAAYMDFQARLSRIFTIGVGPLNGLVVDVNCGPPASMFVQSIGVSPGFGISSDGYLFQIRERCEFIYVRVVGADENLFKCARQAFGGLSNDVGPLLELSETSEVGFEPLFGFELEGGDDCDFAVVLIRCEEEIERRRCFTDCEAAGADRSASIRAVLVNKEWVTPQEDAGIGGEATVINFSQPKPLLRRFGHTDNCLKLCGIHTWQEFYQSYWIQVASSPLVSALNSLHPDFRLKLGDDTNAQLGGRIAPHINAYSNGEAAYMNIQYLYAYLRDLLVAYRELVAAAEGMTVLEVNAEGGDEPGAFIDAFPGHLVLGCLRCGSQGGGGSNLRSPSISSGIKDFGDPQRILAEHLYQRLNSLTTSMNLRLPGVAGTDIRITPGLYKKNTLNGRAIPFYYQGISSEVWNSAQAIQFPSHHYTAQNANHPLLSEYCEYDFFRVEGHVGRPLEGSLPGEGALARIIELRECYNIAFDIQQVRIGPGAELEMNQEPVFGEMDELYQNTRADVLCKLEEIPSDADENVATIRNILTSANANFLRGLPHRDLPPNNVTDDCCGSIIDRGLSEDFLTALNRAASSISALRLTLNTARDIFQELVRKYHRVAQELERQRAFCGFAHRHPGLEHKGGVPKGGTLVLVYAYRLDARGRGILDPQNTNRSDEELIIENINNLQGVNLQKTVVADFCLPYLCCSSAPVVRNEIRTIRATINIEGPFCSDERLRFTVSPEGGRMRFWVGGYPQGEVIDPVIGEQELEISSILTDQSLFVNGRAIITLEYIAGGALVTEPVEVYKKPNLTMQVERGEVCYDENCVPIGYNFTFHITNADGSPVELAALTALSLAWPGNVVYLKTDADFDGRAYTRCIQFRDAPNCILTATLNAQNGLCPENVNEVELNLSSEATLKYKLPNDTAFSELIPEDDNTIQYTADEMPPFMIIEANPAGGDVRFTTDTAQGQTITASLQSALSSEGCESRLYYLIFSIEATLAFLENNPVSPLTRSMVTAATEFPLADMGMSGILAYTLPCWSNTYMLTMIPIPPMAPDGDGSPNTENDDDRDGQPIIGDVTARRSPVSDALSDASLVPAAQQLLNQRQAANTLAFRNLEEADPTLGNAAGFKLAKQFLLKQGDAAKLSQDFVSAAESLLLGMNRAGASRKARYGVAFTPLAHAYFDKVLALAAPAGPVMETAWTTIAVKAAEAGIDLAAVRKGWKAADLRKTIDKERVNALDKLLK